MKKTSTFKLFLWLSLFAISMGFLEAAVVIYLRELYYPSGFQFPLQILPEKTALVEIFREAATIIMLVGVAFQCGHSKLTRFAYFLIAFAIWDLFYYVFLYLFIDWPQSFFTWDILFLIPFPWTGPVIAPCLVCAGLLVLAFSVLYFDKQGDTKISPFQWLLLIGGCIIIITSFMWDYFSVIDAGKTTFLPGKKGLLEELKTYVPVKFNWPLFLLGLSTSCLGTILFVKNSLTLNYNKQ